MSVFGDGDRTEAIFSLDGEHPEEEVVCIDARDQALHFWRRLAKSEIAVDCKVRLGLAGEVGASAPRSEPFIVSAGGEGSLRASR